MAPAEVPHLLHVAHEPFPPPLRALDLTATQQDQIFKIFHEQASAMHGQLKQVRRSGEELRKLAAADRFDEGRARQSADAQAKALAALAVMRAISSRALASRTEV